MASVREIIYWHEPVKSGIFMAAGLTALISLSCLSLVSIIAYAGLALLCCTAGHRIYHFLLGSSRLGNKQSANGTVTDPFGSWVTADLQLPREKIASRAAASSAQLNARIKYVQDMVLLKNYFDTIQFVILLYFLSIIGSYFNLLTLVTVGFTLGMTLPKIYIMYQPHFDAIFTKLKKHTNDVYAKIQPTLKKLRGIGQRTQ